MIDRKFFHDSNFDHFLIKCQSSKWQIIFDFYRNYTSFSIFYKFSIIYRKQTGFHSKWLIQKTGTQLAIDTKNAWEHEMKCNLRAVH